MKKYIVTDKHPELKEGIELKKAISDNFVYCHIGSIEHGFNAEKEWVKKGYIREIQEPKWTDDDMKDLINFSKRRDMPCLDADCILIRWKQSKS